MNEDVNEIEKFIFFFFYSKRKSLAVVYYQSWGTETLVPEPLFCWFLVLETIITVIFWAFLKFFFYLKSSLTF